MIKKGYVSAFLAVMLSAGLAAAQGNGYIPEISKSTPILSVVAIVAIALIIGVVLFKNKK